MKNQGKKNAFEIAVNLFYSGELTILSVVPGADGYSIMMDELKLATVAKDDEGHWTQPYRRIPLYIAEQIEDRNDRHVGDYKSVLKKAS